MKLEHRGEVHLAEDKGLGWAMVLCNRSLFPPFSWTRVANDAKLTCKDCRAYERRQKKEKGG